MHTQSMGLDEGIEPNSDMRALGNAELRVLVRKFFPWDACFSLGGSSMYACFILVGMR